MCNQLFENWCKEQYTTTLSYFSVVNGAGGDGGVESYAVLNDDKVIGLTVNNKDLTRMFQYIANWDVEVNEPALDTNGDGSVNNKDLTRLFQYLAGWDVEIHCGTVTSTKCPHQLTAVAAKAAVIFLFFSVDTRNPFIALSSD